MKFITLTNHTYIVALLLCLSACSEKENVLHPQPLPGQKDVPIRWTVKSAFLADSRALIEDDAALQRACTPGDGGKEIGIWSAYELDGKQTEHVLGNPVGDVALTYREGTEWDNYQGWTYGEEAVFWTPKAEYTFNAYYPKSVIREISSSDVSTFVVEYNTELYQEDLMTAYAYVDTKAPGFYASNPVQLNLLHTLAALRFRFMFMNADGSTYEDSDALTACWLENTVSGQGLATTGDLAFGTVQADGTMDGEHIHWYHEDHPEPSAPGNVRRIYAWEDADGVAFYSTSISYTPGISHSTGGQAYSGNEGWVVTIPQETDGTTQLCFRLETTGDVVHRITLPSIIYEAGKRYTYDIRFGQTEVDLKLAIADWNELKSSYDIPL